MSQTQRSGRMPGAGSVLAIPLPDGMHGACWIVGRRDSLELEGDEHGVVLVALMDVFSNKPASPSEFDASDVLVSTRPRFEGDRQVFMVVDPPPGEFVTIATRAPSDVLASTQCRRFSTWDGLRVRLHMEYLWRHDRAAHDELIRASMARLERMHRPPDDSWEGLEKAPTFPGGRSPGR